MHMTLTDKCAPFPSLCWLCVQELEQELELKEDQIETLNQQLQEQDGELVEELKRASVSTHVHVALPPLLNSETYILCNNVPHVHQLRCEWCHRHSHAQVTFKLCPLLQAQHMLMTLPNQWH